MDIQTYLKKHDLTQEAFADLLGVSQGSVWQWITKRTKPKPAHAKLIEEVTGGKIRRHELRPDLWERIA